VKKVLFSCEGKVNANLVSEISRVNEPLVCINPFQQEWIQSTKPKQGRWADKAGGLTRQVG
jgi:hypothetical protein